MCQLLVGQRARIASVLWIKLLLITLRHGRVGVQFCAQLTLMVLVFIGRVSRRCFFACVSKYDCAGRRGGV